MGRRGVGAKPVTVVPRKPKFRMSGASRADPLISWIERLPVTTGPLVWTRFKVRPWQREFLEGIYNPTGVDGRRQVRSALLSMGRKNGKTGLCAMLALAHLCGPLAEQRGQIYSAAADRKQAGLPMRWCRPWVRGPRLS